MSPINVAVIAFDRISPFHLSVPCIVFGDDGAGSPFRLKVCGAEPGQLATSAGFSLGVELGLEALDTADMVVIPSWRDPSEPPPAALLSALSAANDRGARLVGLCLGAYVLAAAGLLDGRAATTHWAWAADFACRFPRVRLDANVLYVDDGNLTTSAGTAAGLDCCLHLLRDLQGADVANALARRLVVPPHRQGSQAQYIEQPLPLKVSDSRMAALLDLIRGSLHQQHTLDALAARVMMSRRTFTRRFMKITGMTPGAWLLAERLAYARRLLESSNTGMEEIAQTCGLGTAASLRQHFAQRLNISPSAYRRTFHRG